MCDNILKELFRFNSKIYVGVLTIVFTIFEHDHSNQLSPQLLAAYQFKLDNVRVEF